MPAGQASAPYLDAVVAYGTRGPGRFHVPGHKGGQGADPAVRFGLGRALALDIPQDIWGVDLGVEPTPYDEAERLAAEAHGAARTFFLTNGATQGNHALCLALAPLGAHVVVQRNSHASVVDGLVLSGGVPLVVDQSWGPHFGFHEGVPESALALGADAVLTSTHKIAGALTQAAMLHVADGLVDPELVSRSIRLVRSTSPSSLLLASLDGARRQLALHGEQMLHETLAAIAEARAKLATIEHVAVIDNADPLRIVLDLRASGRTGYEWSDALRRSYDVNVELATQATIVFLVGLGERPETLRRLAGDVEEVAKRIARAGETSAIVRPPATLDNEMAVSPRDAFLGAAELVSADDAVGRVSCESIAGYPPGIPALLPGERIGFETVAYLREIVAGGARLHGASDSSFASVNVLIEE